MQWKTLALLAASVLLSAQADNPSSDLTERVTRMARIGSVTAPTFSPDGRWLSVLSNLSGTPQVYVIPSSGGWPQMITDGTDPVVGAAWAPRGGMLAITIAPGGGLNTQVYVIRAGYGTPRPKGIYASR
jgi:Tol biopolymer transport system component